MRTILHEYLHTGDQMYRSTNKFYTNAS